MKQKNYEKLTIKEWNISDRPREKYIAKGIQSLSDAELLALIIRNGTNKESAVDVSRKLIAKAKNNLNEIALLSIEDIMKVNGIGKVKAISIKAAFELGNRRRALKILDENRINTPADVLELMQDKIADMPNEEFWAIFLNNNSKILNYNNFGKGNVGNTIVDVANIIKRALDLRATAIIACHNHPSGNLKASESDIKLTLQIQSAAKLLNIKLIDHIIVSGDKYSSFVEEGLI